MPPLAPLGAQRQQLQTLSQKIQARPLPSLVSLLRQWQLLVQPLPRHQLSAQWSVRPVSASLEERSVERLRVPPAWLLSAAEAWLQVAQEWQGVRLCAASPEE
ncbi:hypothetical protein ABFU27_17170 [Xanthomonas campestris pv. raphani]|uniref:hypothetical protein n=1 Tax=Xanthomonas campestris TaxID=339 RepID=UPI002B3712D1|nr:hypothetical protein [Xanthomonas campestris pv. raphani]MEA9941213.1 hypothetical protein [Xanthomonas campestris pv. raphani]